MAQRLLGGLGAFHVDVVTSMAGGVASRLITLASLPIIAYFYVPAELGLWAIILSLTSYLLPVVTLRYDIAVVIAPTIRMARALVVGVAINVLLVATLAAIAVLLLPTSFWSTVSGLTSQHHALLAFMPVLLVFLGAQLMLQSFLARLRKFKAIGASQVTQAVVTTLVSLGLLLFFPPNGATAAAGGVAGFGMAVIVLLWGARSELPHLRKIQPSTVWHAARRYKVYPIFLLPYSLSGGLSDRVLQVAMASSYSVATVGAYYVARQLLMGPAILLSNSLRQVLFAHSARQTDRDILRAQVVQLLHVVISIVGPCVAFGIFWVSPAITLLLPSTWTHVADYAFWIMFPASLNLLTGSLDRMMDVLGRQRLAVFLQISSDSLIILLMLLGPRMGMNDLTLVAALSIFMATYEIVWLSTLLRLLKVKFSEVRSLVLLGGLSIGGWTLGQFVVKSLLSVNFSLVIAIMMLLLGLVPVAMRLAAGLRKNGIPDGA